VAQAIGRGQALPAVPPQATVSRDWRRFSDEFAKNTDRISHELSQCLVGLPSFHVYDTEELEGYFRAATFVCSPFHM